RKSRSTRASTTPPLLRNRKKAIPTSATSSAKASRRKRRPEFQGSGIRNQQSERFLIAFSEYRCRSLFPGGAIAQMGERVNGIHEVGGSIPPGSTTFRPKG